jgi:hypothetical protein
LVLVVLLLSALAPSAALATTEDFFDNNGLNGAQGFASTDAHSIYFIESQADHNDMCVQPLTGVAGLTGLYSIGSDGACSVTGDSGYVFTSFSAYGYVHAWLGNENSFRVTVSYSDFDY